MNLPALGDETCCDEDEIGDLYVRLSDQYNINGHQTMERFSLA